MHDSHPMNLEKTIDCVDAYLKNQNLSKIEEIQSVLKSLLEKGFSASKPVIRDKTLDTILLILKRYGVDMFGILNGGLSHKMVKVSWVSDQIQIAAVNLAKELMSKLGIDGIPFKHLLRPLQPLSQHQNSQMRGAVMNFYVEAYSFIGDKILPLLSHLKPSQMSELESQFSRTQVKSIKSSPGSNKKQHAGLDHSSAKPKVQKVAFEIDPYELAEEVNPWGRFNSDWMEVVMKQAKWEEKQSRLEQMAQVRSGITQACDKIKLRAEGVEGVLPGLRSLVAQPNANIATAAAQVICKIANGTRQEFKIYAKGLIPMLMEKYKEKKPSLIKAVKEALGVLGRCYKDTMNEVLQELVALLGDKNPTVKVNTLRWIKSNLRESESPKDMKSVSNAVAPLLKKLVNDSQGDVRDAALDLFGALRARLGTTALSALYAELNPPKQKKINEAMNETLKQLGGVDTQESCECAPFKAEERGPRFGNQREKNEEVKKPFQRPMMRPNAAPPPPAQPKAVMKLAPAVEEQKQTPHMTKQEALDRLSESVPSGLLSGLESELWKEKLGAIQNIAAWSSEQNDLPEDLIEALIVHLKGKLRDFKESNVMLGKAWIALMINLAKLDALHRKACSLFFSVLCEKLADSKFKTVAEECMLCVASSLGPGFVCKILIHSTKEAKNPNVIKEACNMLIQLPQEFGSANGLPVMEILDCGKTAISHNNVAVRKAGSELLVSYYRWLGPKSKGLVLSNVKEQAVKQLESELDKAVPYGEGEFQPKRELQGEAARMQDNQPRQKKKGGGGAEALLDQMMPRKDISNQISKKLLKDLNDANGKVRIEALERVQDLIHAGGDRIALSGTSELIGVLSARLKEETSNKIAMKNLVVTIGILGYALGRVAQKVKGKFFPHILDLLSSKAADVRTALLSALDQWASSIGAEQILSFTPERLKSQSSELRVALLDWIAAQIQNNAGGGIQFQLVMLVKPLFNCLGSRDPKVRGSAQHLMAELGPILGRDPFQRELKLSGGSQLSLLRGLIQKYVPAFVRPAPTLEKKVKPLQRVESEKALPKANYQAPPAKFDLKKAGPAFEFCRPQAKGHQTPSLDGDSISGSQTDSVCSKVQEQSKIGRGGFGFGQHRPRVEVKGKPLVRRDLNQQNQGVQSQTSQEQRENVARRLQFGQQQEVKKEKTWKEEFIDREFQELVDCLKYGNGQERRKGLDILSGWVHTEHNERLLEGGRVNEIIDGILNILKHGMDGYEKEHQFMFQFLEVMYHLAKNESAMRVIKELRLFRLLEQLMARILYFMRQRADNENPEESQSEAEWVPQVCVADMVRDLQKRFKTVLSQVIGHSDATTLFCALVQLLAKHRFVTDDESLISLISRTTLKFGGMLEKRKDELVLDRAMRSLHEYYQSAQRRGQQGGQPDTGDIVVVSLIKELMRLYGLKEVEQAMRRGCSEAFNGSTLLMKVRMAELSMEKGAKTEEKEESQSIEEFHEKERLEKIMAVVEGFKKSRLAL